MFSLGLAVVLVPLFLIGRGELGRLSGALLVSAYVGYAVFRIAGAT